MDGKFGKIERIKRTIDMLAYGSLALDICIALITTLSIFHAGGNEFLLIQINYMLTIVVVLSIGLFITLIVLKHEEKILDNLLIRRYRYTYGSRFRPLVDNFKMKLHRKLKRSS